MYWQQNSSGGGADSDSLLSPSTQQQQQEQAVTPLSSDGSIGPSMTRPFVDDSHILRYEDIDDDFNDEDDEPELSNTSDDRHLTYRQGKFI